MGWDGMGCKSVTCKSIKFTQYPFRGSVRVKCLAQEHITESLTIIKTN